MPVATSKSITGFSRIRRTAPVLDVHEPVREGDGMAVHQHRQVAAADSWWPAMAAAMGALVRMSPLMVNTAPFAGREQGQRPGRAEGLVLLEDLDPEAVDRPSSRRNERTR